jgi:hypothetical protein
MCLLVAHTANFAAPSLPCRAFFRNELFKMKQPRVPDWLGLVFLITGIIMLVVSVTLLTNDP